MINPAYPHPLNIALAASFTIEPIVPHLSKALLSKGVDNPVYTIAPYNQLFQVCLNPSSTLKQENINTIVIIWRIEDIFGNALEQISNQSDLAKAHAFLFDEINSLLNAIKNLRLNFEGTIIVSTPPYPSFLPFFDHYDLDQSIKGNLLHTDILRYWITSLIKMESIQIIDLHGALQQSGYEDSQDIRKWYLYKQPYTELFWSHFSKQLARIISVQTQPGKKCLVLDCDNTLWGGIVGEDGIANIALGHDFPGSAYRDFQKYLLLLAKKGIFLAIASKNNPEDVIEMFETHDSMVLSKSDISVFQVHWDSKVNSIKTIANTLNIALNSIVFVDDNPKELSEVQERIPEVTCYLVPEELAELPELLKKDGLFDSAQMTEEDRARREMVSVEQQRIEQREQQTEEQFLSSLNLNVDVFEVESRHLARVTQLINKTNQFNLTTKRRTHDEIEALHNLRDTHIFGMTADDRFGKYGLVGVAIICRENNSTWYIDSLLMSCRVLGRNVESALLSTIAQIVNNLGGKILVGEYIASNKNIQVADLYKNYGFSYDDLKGKWIAYTSEVPHHKEHISVNLSMHN